MSKPACFLLLILSPSLSREQCGILLPLPLDVRRMNDSKKLRDFIKWPRAGTGAGKALATVPDRGGCSYRGGSQVSKPALSLHTPQSTSLTHPVLDRNTHHLRNTHACYSSGTAVQKCKDFKIRLITIKQLLS